MYFHGAKITYIIVPPHYKLRLLVACTSHPLRGCFTEAGLRTSDQATETRPQLRGEERPSSADIRPGGPASHRRMPCAGRNGCAGRAWRPDPDTRRHKPEGWPWPDRHSACGRDQYPLSLPGPPWKGLIIPRAPTDLERSQLFVGGQVRLLEGSAVRVPSLLGARCL